MFRRLSRWAMSPEAMEKWLAHLPGLMDAFEQVEEDVVIESMWVTKDRTQWFFIRTLESEEADDRMVEQLFSSDWGKKYASLMEEHTHHSYDLESVFP